MYLTKTRFSTFKKMLYGFDIETYDKNKKFLMASIYSEYPMLEWQNKNYKIFYDKRKLIDEFKTKKFCSSVVCATNLSFDFNGTFFNEEEAKYFKTLFRGSELINAYSYIENDKFTLEPKHKRRDRISFLDSMNYASLGVEKLGKLIGISKLEKPEFLGRKPKTEVEKNILEAYNVRDSEISCKAVRFLYDSFEKFGSTPKMTIASSSMSLFRNRYLKKDYYCHKPQYLAKQLKSYYGGRCEAVGRGFIEDYYYYDFNSLYPSVMHDNIFPDVNTLRQTKKEDIGYIMQYEGISDVTLSCPYMDYPLLPYRQEGKLLFPIGKFRGWYTNVELRKAIQTGYTIIKIHEMMYFKENCEPFREFVSDLYSKRKELKEQKSPMEYVVKILLNSLYGKFGQKFLERDNYVHVSTLSAEEINSMPYIMRIGDYFHIRKTSKPSCFCIPVWASYITAYARLKLFDAISLCHPVYYDTDSLITKMKLPDSSELGKLKLEMKIKEGMIIRPKFYAFISDDKEYIKIKGLGRKLSYKQFNELLKNPKVFYTKFARFKEAIKRNFIPNEIIKTHKEFSLEDGKRFWKSDFSHEFSYSTPLEIGQEGIDIPFIIYNTNDINDRNI